MNKDKNQDQEQDYRMDSVSENVSDARLSQIFGEAWAMSLRRKKRWQLGKLSRRSIFLQRRNHYRRQKMNYQRKR